MALSVSTVPRKRGRISTIVSVVLISGIFLFSHGIHAMGEDNRKGKRGERPKPPSFESLDVNQDGVVTLDEFELHKIPRGDHTTVFGFIDTNQDGQITQEELTSHKPPKHRKGKSRDQQAYSSQTN